MQMETRGSVSAGQGQGRESGKMSPSSIEEKRGGKREKKNWLIMRGRQL